MSKLTLKPEWLEPGFWPSTLYESPFLEMQARPAWPDVAAYSSNVSKQWEGSLESFAAQLLEELRSVLHELGQPLHVCVSGGYDSRILAFLLEELGHEPLYVTDGDEEPTCSRVLEYLDIPESRLYLHDMDRPDPYGLADATVLGWAPIYHQMKFTPVPPARTTLVTGLGGGEWFDYPASGWHKPRQHRTGMDDPLAMWLDTWPQYWLLPHRWAEGYWHAVHPYCTSFYAQVANQCRDEWLVRRTGGIYPELDLVRETMLELLDPELAGLGYEPHRYDWRLGGSASTAINERYFNSWLFTEGYKQAGIDDSGYPSRMDEAEHSCLMAGFAQWCDWLIDRGHTIEVAS